MHNHAPPQTSAQAVEFPAFCVAPPNAARRSLPTLGEAWASQYKADGVFPELPLLSVGPGSLVFTESAMDIAGQPGPRIYLIQELLSAVQRALAWTKSAEVENAFESQIGRPCWGVLALVACRRRPHTLASLRAHIEALLHCWQSLNTLRYVDASPDPVSLSALMKRRFAGLLVMWSSQSTGDLTKDLTSAFHSLETSLPQARLDKAANWLAHIAASNKRIRNTALLADPNFFRRKLPTIRSSERESIEIGNSNDALTLLYAIDRELSSAKNP